MHVSYRASSSKYFIGDWQTNKSSETEEISMLKQWVSSAHKKSKFRHTANEKVKKIKQWKRLACIQWLHADDIMHSLLSWLWNESFLNNQYSKLWVHRLCGRLQAHSLFWFMSVQQCKVQKGWVKVNIDLRVINEHTLSQSHHSSRRSEKAEPITERHGDNNSTTEE